jgi:hypothetical protein
MNQVSIEQFSVEDDLEIDVVLPLSAGSMYPLINGAVNAVEGAVGLMRFTTETCIHIASEASKNAANTFLDNVVPPVFNAIISRVDLTEIVVKNVNINEIVAQADINPILDRIPMTEIADYVIDEIDLPTLVRESTGGVADEILGLLRFQAIETDNFFSSVVDKVLFRSKTRAQEITTEVISQ